MLLANVEALQQMRFNRHEFDVPETQQVVCNQQRNLEKVVRVKPTTAGMSRRGLVPVPPADMCFCST